MKNIFYTIIFACAIVFVNTGCDDALDINTNPLAATQVDPNLLFPEVFVNLANNRTVEVSGTVNATQQWEGGLGVFNDNALGDVSIFTTGNTWANYYATGLKNLELAEQDAAALDPQNVNVIAQTKIMKAFIFFNLTMLWERVPFTQALDPSIATPEFDEQRVILDGIVTLVDEASALINKDPETFRVDNGDMIYAGNLDNWEKFGNAIKLQALMCIANVDPGAVSAEIANTLASPIIRTLDEEAEFQYFNVAGEFNPLWNTLNRFAGGANPEWWVASTKMIEVMDELNDPRKATYFDDSDLPGAEPGSFANEGIDNALVSLNILRPDFPDRMATAPEILLLEAEAIIQGWASGDANARFQEAIQLSMDYFDGKPGEIAQADKDAYLASLPDITSLGTDAALEAIGIQLWLQTFMRTQESWTHWRRTGVPELDVPSGSLLSDIMRRLAYPPDERGANPNTPQDPDLEAPMWYEN